MTKFYIFTPEDEVLGTQDAPGLLSWVKQRLDAGTSILLLDLHHVLSLESSGIGILMIVHNWTRRAGVRFALCSVNEEVLLQIERAGITDKFELYANREEFDRFMGRDND